MTRNQEIVYLANKVVSELTYEIGYATDYYEKKKQIEKEVRRDWEASNHSDGFKELRIAKDISDKMKAEGFERKPDPDVVEIMRKQARKLLKALDFEGGF